MHATAIADSGYLVALLSRRDARHDWAVAQAEQLTPPWDTCEAVLMETFYLLGAAGASSLIGLLRRRDLRVSFGLSAHQEAVLTLIERYADVPMSLADACLVRMSETLPQPVVLTTDSDFRVYRRHSRQVVPCILPA